MLHGKRIEQLSTATPAHAVDRRRHAVALLAEDDALLSSVIRHGVGLIHTL